MKKDDLRVVKTKKALYDALIDLMRDKSFEEIKVSDICNKALVNRSTFYAHYDDKYELLKDCINDLKTSLQDELNKNTNTNNLKEYYIELTRLFLNHIEERRDDYLAIAINNRNSILTDILYDVIDNDITSHLKDDEEIDGIKIPRNILVKFYLGAVVNIGITWIQNINKYTKEEIISYLTALLPDIYK